MILLDTQIAKPEGTFYRKNQNDSSINNKKGVEEAEKQMEKQRHAYLGQYSDNGS
ncbi:MAG: hypothetical protein V8Q93_10540 [Blautia faecis]